ncbi:MAG TPA: hypothetical protein VKZ83_13245, partial [Phototrophicaceae bacterium]|nr:hypothetical protein [Phototrophicaceae bacterium]
QCPEDEKTYLHRIGRTARAGTTGVAITFVDWDDMPRWGLINKTLGLGLEEPPETYHTSPHLYADLSIPTEVTGRLPRSARTRAGLAAEKLEDLGETGKSAGRGNRGGSGGRQGGGGRPDGGRRSGGEARRSEGGEARRSEGSAPREGAPRRRRRRTRKPSSSSEA